MALVSFNDVLVQGEVPSPHHEALLILDLGATWLWAVKFTPWSPYRREGTPVPIELEARWAPEPVLTFLRRENSGTPTWIRNPDRPATMYQE
jgi:hypothetical protein